VAPRQRVPVTAVLRIDDARRDRAEGQIHASLELYTEQACREKGMGCTEPPALASQAQ
jgi:hypothetical protein